MSSETKRKEVTTSKKGESKEEDSLSWGFKILTILTVIGTGCLFLKVMEFRNKLYIFNPNYEFPTRYQCFLVIVYICCSSHSKSSLRISYGSLYRNYYE